MDSKTEAIRQILFGQSKVESCILEKAQPLSHRHRPAVTKAKGIG